MLLAFLSSYPVLETLWIELYLITIKILWSKYNDHGFYSHNSLKDSDEKKWNFKNFSNIELRGKFLFLLLEDM